MISHRSCTGLPIRRHGFVELTKAALQVSFGAGDPPSESEQSSRLMEIENRIAEGIFNVDDWWALEHMSAPSGLNCPNCRSALYELKDQRVLRYRCRSGHAYSAQALLSGQEEYSRGPPVRTFRCAY